MNTEDMKTAILGTLRSAIERVDKNGVQGGAVDYSRNISALYGVDRDPVEWEENGFTLKISVTYISPAKFSQNTGL